MNRLIIIDALNLVRRMHATQPDESDMDALELRISSAINKLIKFHAPTHMVLVWDGDGDSWRKALYEDYKKGRKPMPESLQKGLDKLKQQLSDRKWQHIDADSEADDVVATLAMKLASKNGQAIIVSTDNGYSQLNHPMVSQWDHFGKHFFDIEAYEQKLGVEREQFLEYWSLAGSSGNRIPGVPGIGPKSAAQLLGTFRSVKNIYGSLEQLGEKQAQKLEAGKEMARLSYKLAQLKTDMPLKVSLNQFRLTDPTSKN
ncbi:flap endonuclease Xni [Shewanella sp. 202IG2-18]|uniref:flap endonuclease Xni n=1 Tax=Parashewanella hymeniacidonis TaxID=2807618 RepID=UPI001961FBBA|nr:flap endonuclease Xni [Parashewanella hymeniacidonis]